MYDCVRLCSSVDVDTEQLRPLFFSVHLNIEKVFIYTPSSAAGSSSVDRCFLFHQCDSSHFVFLSVKMFVMLLLLFIFCFCFERLITRDAGEIHEENQMYDCVRLCSSVDVDTEQLRPLFFSVHLNIAKVFIYTPSSAAGNFIKHNFIQEFSPCEQNSKSKKPLKNRFLLQDPPDEKRSSDAPQQLNPRPSDDAQSSRSPGKQRGQEGHRRRGDASLRRGSERAEAECREEHGNQKRRGRGGRDARFPPGTSMSSVSPIRCDRAAV
ncbi:hypothetical protein F2P81_006714 [Scophthalmus maximus]|uniref:Uncharacterized protein n=1 Tax=Scophthalmus maximus TaxID=52904 RepID=A0A6A4T018_SCOMX|nr:hypothetical protein F2P81_006714 [Scophthalmus maximus]